jgi:hypothetical protein
MSTSQVTCPCGALYERTEFNAAVPETDRFDCQICDETLERFTKPKTPSYRLRVGPVTGAGWADITRAATQEHHPASACAEPIVLEDGVKLASLRQAIAHLVKTIPAP